MKENNPNGGNCTTSTPDLNRIISELRKTTPDCDTAGTRRITEKLIELGLEGLKIKDLYKREKDLLGYDFVYTTKTTVEEKKADGTWQLLDDKTPLTTELRGVKKTIMTGTKPRFFYKLKNPDEIKEKIKKELEKKRKASDLDVMSNKSTDFPGSSTSTPRTSVSSDMLVDNTSRLSTLPIETINPTCDMEDNGLYSVVREAAALLRQGMSAEIKPGEGVKQIRRSTSIAPRGL